MELLAQLIEVADPTNGEIVVDLGCGTGTGTRLIAERAPGAHITAIDPDPAMVAVAEREVGTRARVLVGDAAGLADVVPAAGADLLVLGNCIHLIPDVEQLFRDAAGRLRDGGRLVFNTAFAAGAEDPGDRHLYWDLLLDACRHARQAGARPTGRSGERPPAKRAVAPDDYRRMAAAAGLDLDLDWSWVELDLDTVAAILGEPVFAAGVLPGVPPDAAAELLATSVRSVAARHGRTAIRRGWLVGHAWRAAPPPRSAPVGRGAGRAAGRVPAPLEGRADAPFADAVALLADQLAEGTHHGAGLTVVHRGRVAVDVWGGQRTAAEGTAPWREDTMAVALSATKGLTALALLMAAEEAGVGLDTPVRDLWPETRDGRITVRHLLTHQAGIPHIRAHLPRAELMADWDHMVRAVASLEPMWVPGTRHGYHGLTFGWLAGELVRRISGQDLGAFIRSAVADRLGLDGALVGVPPPDQHRVAPLLMPDKPVYSRIRQVGERSKQTLLLDALPTLDELVPFVNSPEGLASCAPSFGGCFTARSLARLYAALAAGPHDPSGPLLPPDRLVEIRTPQNRRRPDLVLKYPVLWTLGFMNKAGLPVTGPQTFGMAGFAGSIGFADPEAELALGFVCDQIDVLGFGGRRTDRLVRAIYEGLGRA